MKRFNNILFLGVMIFMGVIAGPAQATLVTIGTAAYNGGSYNLIYDDDAPFGSIVWLDYTNPNAFWAVQNAWANSLNIAGELTYSLNPGYSVTWAGDWRLPNTVDDVSSFGFGVTTSEMGHLFYTELGREPAEQWSNPTDYFTNLKPGWYWSDTVYAGNLLWSWAFVNGYQDVRDQGATGLSFLGLAVRPGQVEAAPVPEPSTLLLLGGGLAGWRLRRRGR